MTATQRTAAAVAILAATAGVLAATDARGVFWIIYAIIAIGIIIELLRARHA